MFLDPVILHGKNIHKKMEELSTTTSKEKAARSVGLSPIKWMVALTIAVINLTSFFSGQRLTTRWQNDHAISSLEVREASQVKVQAAKVEHDELLNKVGEMDRPSSASDVETSISTLKQKKVLSTQTHQQLAAKRQWNNQTIQDKQQVPKSGLLEQAAKKRPRAAKKRPRSAKKQRRPEVFSHYLGHVPKSGTSFAFGAIVMLAFQLQKSHDVKEKFRPCNMGTGNSSFWQNFLYQYKGDRCTMWMTEPGTYNAQAQHGYVILREPVSHTLSMFFHCAESEDHSKRAKFMPSLDEWITAWHGAYANSSLAKKNKKFQCYNPLNFQSKTIGYDPSLGKDDLRKKWDIIGDNSRMDKTICLIVIKYTGWVPEQCDCTDIPDQQSENRRRRRLYELTYDKHKHGHGVAHHGSDHNITAEQRKKIEKFRQIDIQLYNLVVTEIFEEQVREVEQEHKIKLCDKLRLNATMAGK